MRPFCDVRSIPFRQKNMSVLGVKTDMFFALGHVQNNVEMQMVFLRKILYNVCITMVDYARFSLLKRVALKESRSLRDLAV